MDKAAAIKCVKQYAHVVEKHYPVKMVILYGSYVKGTAREDSDIDVAVILDSVQEDFLAIGSRLFKLRRQIDSRIEPVLLDDRDDISGFLSDILENGEIVYQAQ